MDSTLLCRGLLGVECYSRRTKEIFLASAVGVNKPRDYVAGFSFVVYMLHYGNQSHPATLDTFETLSERKVQNDILCH